MDKKILAQVEKTLHNASIASVRSWLKGNGKKFSAGTRDRMIARVATLIEKSEITFAELEDAIIGIEEAGGKLLVLYKFDEDCTSSAVKTQLAKLGLTIATTRQLAKPSPSKPTVAYATLQGDVLRVKWSETHNKPRMDFDQDKVEYDDVSKVIVLVANLKTKKAEIRYDRPEIFHPHSGSAKAKDSYFNYYAKLAETILGVKLIKSELQKALKKLIEDQPSLVRLHRGGHTNQRNNYFSGTVRKGEADIRDDDEYKAMYAKSGNAWSYEDQSFYWRPDRSDGALTRQVFSHVDTLASSLRVDADCWDAEVEYAVQKIRELQ